MGTRDSIVTAHSDSNKLWGLIKASGPKNDGDICDHRFEHRNKFLEECSFAVPTREAITVIKEFVDGRRLLEVGAGSGLWARLLTDAGLEVVAVDRKSRNDVKHSKFFPVQRGTAARGVREHRDCKALLLCWPDYDTHMAADALKEFQGDRLVYIGEGDGGCTGNEAFHKSLRSWKLVATIYIPQWPGIHDDVSLYTRGGE